MKTVVIQIKAGSFRNNTLRNNKGTLNGSQENFINFIARSKKSHVQF